MPVNEASSEETPYGRYVTSAGWFVLNLTEAIGLRPKEETLYYPVSEVAARHGASVAKETYEPEEAYADWPGDYEPLRLEWPVARTVAS